MFIVPRKTQVCIDYFRKHQLLSYVTIQELNIDLIPIDNDILSFEYNSSFYDLYLSKDPTVLKTIAETLIMLQVIYGPFETIDGFGKNSLAVMELLSKFNISDIQSNSPSRIGRLLLIDRSVDLISPFISALTYEALIHRVRLLTAFHG